MNKIQKHFVCDALEWEHKLTDWESEFINNLIDKFDDRELSDKQNAILNRIQRKVSNY